MANSQNDSSYKGQCLCGAIQYTVDKIESRMGHCHCSMCRKFHGAAFSTYGEARVDNFHWITGKDKLKTYTAPNGTQRQFCEHCGSSMVFFASDSTGEVIEFSLGTLDSHIEHDPDAHIYTDYKASWYDITDNLPQFPKGRE